MSRRHPATTASTMRTAVTPQPSWRVCLSFERASVLSVGCTIPYIARFNFCLMADHGVLLPNLAKTGFFIYLGRCSEEARGFHDRAGYGAESNCCLFKGPTREHPSLVRHMLRPDANADDVSHNPLPPGQGIHQLQLPGRFDWPLG